VWDLLINNIPVNQTYATQSAHSSLPSRKTQATIHNHHPYDNIYVLLWRHAASKLSTHTDDLISISHSRQSCI